MSPTRRPRILMQGATAILFALVAAHATAHALWQTPDTGLDGATVLIIRHAEKPVHGRTLTAQGRARAEAYVDYFEHLAQQGQRLVPDVLVATADTTTSERPRLTLTPLAAAMHLPLDLRFRKKQVHALVRALRTGPPRRVVLVCWHHHQIPALLRAFGADPAQLLPHGHWPDAVFDWVLVLHFDAQGRLLATDSHRIVEHLLPGDGTASATATAAAPGQGARDSH